MHFSLLPELDATQLKQQFNKDSRVQIPQIMPTESLQAMYNCMHNEISYDQAVILNGQAQLLPTSDLQNLNQLEAQNLLKQVYDSAAKGIGFWYGRAPTSEHDKNTLQAFKQWLNSEKVFTFIKTITGEVDICNTIIQYTRYHPGDFLTRHKDLGAENTRKIAFVFHLSPQWHPDWGGLLQFYQQDGKPRDAWAPAFGNLHLFNTRHIHAVTAISPFAPAARYTISGWFTTK